MPTRQALKGLALLAQGLPRVKADPGDLDARLDCQMGTWLSMGPLAAGVPMGASHGIGYVLGAVHDVPHGHTSCIMLPAVMRWNKSVNAEQQALVSVAMGQPGKDAADVLDAFIARARHAALAVGGEDRARALRADRRASDGHAVGAAQSPQDRRPRAGGGNLEDGAGVRKGRVESYEAAISADPVKSGLVIGLVALITFFGVFVRLYWAFIARHRPRSTP